MPELGAEYEEWCDERYGPVTDEVIDSMAAEYQDRPRIMKTPANDDTRPAKAA